MRRTENCFAFFLTPDKLLSLLLNLKWYNKQKRIESIRKILYIDVFTENYNDIKVND
ncbi:hypothetical protein DMR_32670 [Solidesulfovibrio magneticus RS-1]|uniref:Uncharacterized protein n=1 Tax=Solidesulfovibrio magneticus (strain ATCC 700980 / DSM 13731 / RS-1) TaxID=573370 RepID=C4XJL1_SOLM1|nr:hypothetical protein DMR_32670 [Solidesulfovibrio magneticus RS-1]